MKCLRCGNDIPDNCEVCSNCGFDINYQRSMKVLHKEEDPVLDDAHKTLSIDFPVLTFIFGIIDILLSILIVFSRPLPIIYLIVLFITFGFTFFFSTKKSKVKLKPVREFGVVLGYIALAIALITVFKVLIS